MICAGYGNDGEDSCEGDSGGPLVDVNNGDAKFIAEVSWSYGYTDPKYPGPYHIRTRLD